jgi:hypothetical protein
MQHRNRAIVALLAILLASSEALGEEDHPPEAPFARASAVDHRVVLDDPGSDSRSRLRLVVTQADGWQAMTRSDSPRLTIYSKVDGRWSYWIRRNVDGQLAELSAVTDDQYGQGQPSFEITQTDQNDRVLGPLCEVWRAARGVRYENAFSFCMTADGVELWRHEDNFNSGKPVRRLQAIKVERRGIASSDSMPPALAFDLAAWADRAAQYAMSPVLPKEQHFAVQREGSGRCYSQIEEEIVTSAWSKSLTMAEDQLTTSYGMPGLTIKVLEKPAGFLRSVTVSTAGGDYSGTRKTPPASGETLSAAGETCVWQQPGSHIHGSVAYCLTADGLVLASRVINTRAGIHCSYVVISLRRGDAVSPAEAEPPPDILDRIR